MVNQPKIQQEGLTPNSVVGQTQQPKKGLVVQTAGANQKRTLNLGKPTTTATVAAALDS
jgi:hypothetical protein